MSHMKIKSNEIVDISSPSNLVIKVESCTLSIPYHLTVYEEINYGDSTNVETRLLFTVDKEFRHPSNLSSKSEVLRIVVRSILYIT